MHTGHEKKQIQKQRMVQYFLSATLQIIREEGIDKVTIRKIADIAGYNSATLYNYFENLDHLLFFAGMTYLQDYINDIPTYIKYAKNSRDTYISVWHCFIEYSFMQPEIYYTLFFSQLQKEMTSYIKQYYSFYPIDVKKYPNQIRRMLSDDNISKRSMILMEKCIEEGFFDEKTGQMIDDLVVHLYESLLIRVKMKSLDAGTAKEMMLQYLNLFFDRLSA